MGRPQVSTEMRMTGGWAVAQLAQAEASGTHAIALPILKVQFQPQLHHARGRGPGNHAGQGVADRGIWGREIRAIERIEHFPPQLNTAALAQRKLALNAEVHVEAARGDQEAAPRV